MNIDKLKVKLAEAEELMMKGKYTEAEFCIIELLKSLDDSNDSIDIDTKNELDIIQCKSLIALSELKWNQGDNQTALNLALDSIKLADKLNKPELKAKGYGNIGTVYRYLSEYTQALLYYKKSLTINEEIGAKKGIANYLANLGVVHKDLSDYAQALKYFQKALNIYQEIEDKDGIADNFGNIGVVYQDLLDNTRALSYYKNALVIQEEVGNKRGTANSLMNIGTIYGYLSDYSKALNNFQRALAIFQEIENKNGIANNLGNIGNVHSLLSDYSQTLTYYQKAHGIFEEIGNKNGIALMLYNLGVLYDEKEFDGYNPIIAEEYLHSAIAIGEEIGDKNSLFHTFQSLADLYETQERWKEAHKCLKSYHEIEKEVLNKEAKEQASLVEQRRQAAEREKEIEIAKAAAAARTNATTTLLHRVLPESISTRMINGEENISDFFPSVSILFADIQGFTAISANMKAIDVVRFLNFVFGEFDRIMKAHGCEKIKTIGDGYMAVAGAPIECEDHAERLAAAALEMQETIHLPEDIRSTMPVESRFGIRIGLHTGFVVAGVIGQERFVYDIHSDAVNLASRMESSGEVDRVHVSADFAEHLQARFKQTKNIRHGIRFEDRGDTNIKGKGMMKTYFLESKT